MFALPYFEHQLVMYVTSEDKTSFEDPFDISKIPIVTREQADAEDRTKKLTATAPTLKPPKAGPTKAPAGGAEAAAAASAQAQKYTEELSAIPDMAEFGAVLKSSPVVELTEAETEYVVSLVKHIFKEHVVLQFDVKNTLPDTVLENVSVVATPSDEEELEEVFILQSDKLATDEPGKVYVAFKKVNGENSLPVSSFTNVLRFTSKEIDPSTGEPEDTGYDDEYEVSEFELTGSDYIIPTFASNFNHLWEQIGASGEQAEETLQLSSMKSIAGEFIDVECGRGRDRMLTMTNRRHGTAHTSSVTPTAGWDGCAREPEHTYAQAAGQDGERWTCCCDGAHGIFFKIGRYDKDYCAERGGECSGPCYCICSLKPQKKGTKKKNGVAGNSVTVVRVMIYTMPMKPMCFFFTILLPYYCHLFILRV